MPKRRTRPKTTVKASSAKNARPKQSKPPILMVKAASRMPSRMLGATSAAAAADTALGVSDKGANKTVHGYSGQHSAEAVRFLSKGSITANGTTLIWCPQNSTRFFVGDFSSGFYVQTAAGSIDEDLANSFLVSYARSGATVTLLNETKVDDRSGFWNGAVIKSLPPLNIMNETRLGKLFDNSTRQNTSSGVLNGACPVAAFDMWQLPDAGEFGSTPKYPEYKQGVNILAADPSRTKWNVTTPSIHGPQIAVAGQTWDDPDQYPVGGVGATPTLDSTVAATSSIEWMITPPVVHANFSYNVTHTAGSHLVAFIGLWFQSNTPPQAPTCYKVPIASVYTATGGTFFAGEGEVDTSSFPQFAAGKGQLFLGASLLFEDSASTTVYGISTPNVPQNQCTITVSSMSHRASMSNATCIVIDSNDEIDVSLQGRCLAVLSAEAKMFENKSGATQLLPEMSTKVLTAVDRAVETAPGLTFAGRVRVDGEKLVGANILDDLWGAVKTVGKGVGNFALNSAKNAVSKGLSALTGGILGAGEMEFLDEFPYHPPACAQSMCRELATSDDELVTTCTQFPWTTRHPPHEVLLAASGRILRHSEKKEREAPPPDLDEEETKVGALPKISLVQFLMEDLDDGEYTLTGAIPLVDAKHYADPTYVGQPIKRVSVHGGEKKLHASRGTIAPGIPNDGGEIEVIMVDFDTTTDDMPTSHSMEMFIGDRKSLSITVLYGDHSNPLVLDDDSDAAKTVLNALAAIMYHPLMRQWHQGNNARRNFIVHSVHRLDPVNSTSIFGACVGSIFGSKWPVITGVPVFQSDGSQIKRDRLGFPLLAPAMVSGVNAKLQLIESLPYTDELIVLGRPTHHTPNQGKAHIVVHETLAGLWEAGQG